MGDRMTDTPAGSPGGITGWATGLMEALGEPGAGAAVALENIFPPLPSEVILPLTGFTVSRGDMNLWLAIACTTLGSVLGAAVLYAAGALLGRDRTLALARRIPFVRPEDIERSERWFARHGRKAVFFGRMVPFFRSFISIPAGIARMPLRTFLTLTTLGSLIWNTAFIVAGYLLGEQWAVLGQAMGVAAKAVPVLIAAAVAWWICSRVRDARARRSPSRP